MRDRDIREGLRVAAALIAAAVLVFLLALGVAWADERPPEPEGPRVLTVLTGVPDDYAVLATDRGYVVQLRMTLPPDHYRVVERFGRCLGCRVRIYIIQEPR